MRVVQWNHQVLHHVLLLLVFAATFLLVLPWYCRDWHHSVYFRGDPKSEQYVKRATDLNNQRLRKAEEYFKEFIDIKISGSLDISDRRLLEHQSKIPQDTIGSKDKQSHADLDLTVVIIGMQRKMDNYFPGYWLQTAAEVHRQFTQDTHFRHKRMFICNVDKTPTARKDFYRMNGTLDVIFRFGGQFPNQSAADGKYVKAKDDYAFCLRQAAGQHSRYVLIVEGDALIKPNFFHELHYHLNTNLPLRVERGLHLKPWAFIKLYYPEKWLGYSLVYQHYVELLGIMLLGGSFTVFVFLALKIYKPGACYSSRLSALQWFLVGGLYFLCVCVSVGRPYVVEFLRGTIFSRGRLIPAYDCCIPAVLYHGDVVADLSRNLSITAPKKHHDILVDMWARDNGFQTYLAQPNMVTHIGYVSTQNKAAKKAVDFIF